MSYFAAKYPNQIIPALNKFAAYEGRLEMTRASPTSTTNATFVVPARYATVQITLLSTTGFIAGDFVSIGELFGYVTTAASPTPLINPLTLTMYRLGSWRGGYSAGVNGLYIKGPAGESTTTTSNYTVPFMNAAPVSRTTSVSVASPAVLPNSAICKVTSYAGVYQVVSVDSAALMTVRLIHPGDLVTGDTVVTGAYCSQGTLLGITPNIDVAQFFPMNVLTQVLSVTAGGSANTPAMSVGWGANADSGAATVPYNQFVDGDTSGGGTMGGATSVANDRYKFHHMNGNSTNNASNRLAAPPNMPIFARVQTASTATTYRVIVCVRGFFGTS